MITTQKVLAVLRSAGMPLRTSTRYWASSARNPLRVSRLLRGMPGCGDVQVAVCGLIAEGDEAEVLGDVAAVLEAAGLEARVSGRLVAVSGRHEAA